MTKPLALIIEDAPQLSAVYDIALKNIGFETVLDTDGDRYRDILARAIPAIIILDLHLPYASGAEILREIRASERLAKIPVVVTTADLFQAENVASQANEVLLKPVGVRRLQDVVIRLLPDEPGLSRPV